MGKTEKVGILERIGDIFTRFALRFIPDAFIYALLLTFITIILALILTPRGIHELISAWGERFWGILRFSMESSYGLITCTIIAFSPAFRRMLRKVAELPKTHFQAQLLNVAVATALMNFHWGMLTAAGIFCRELAIACYRKGLRVHYPLLVAGAYAGLLPWHLGLSGASQLLCATKGHFLEKEIGIIPTSQTLFHPYSYIPLILLSIVTIVTIIYMTPKSPERIIAIPAEVLERSLGAEEAPKPSQLPKLKRLSARADEVLSILIGLVILFAIFYDIFARGRGWDLHAFIVTLFGLGLIFHRSLKGFARGIQESLRAASQIFLQFQFYGGIMGLMVFSGLASVIAWAFASISTRYTWPLFNWIQASIINIFVPSGGGQWTATAHIMVEASKIIGTPIAPTTITTFAMGDMWTNMIQPFWALPILGIAGLSIRDIMGYCAVVLITTGIVIALWILIAPFLIPGVI